MNTLTEAEKNKINVEVLIACEKIAQLYGKSMTDEKERKYALDIFTAGVKYAMEFSK